MKNGLVNDRFELLLIKALWTNTDSNQRESDGVMRLQRKHICSHQFCSGQKNLRFQSFLSFSAENRKGNRISIAHTCSKTFTCVHLLWAGVHGGLQNFHWVHPGFCGLPSQTDPGNPPLKSFPGSRLWNGYNLHHIIYLSMIITQGRKE